MRTVARAFALGCVLFVLAPAGRVRAADTADQLLREGVALHDRGDYDGAIAKYRAALKIEPDNLQVTYELGFSLYAKGDRGEAEKVLRPAAARTSPFQPALYGMLGNIDDDNGKLADAIKDYQEAIRLAPNLRLAHFNLGVAYLRSGKLPEARAALENEAVSNPNHPGTQLMLGKTYARAGFRGPAALAFSRFLFMEPVSKRADDARQELESLFAANVKQESPGHVTITMDPKASKEEGDFSGADLIMPMAQLNAGKPGPDGKVSDLEPPIERLATTLKVIAEMGNEKKSSGFAINYYLPFVKTLYDRQEIDLYCRIAYSGATLAKNDAWLAQHASDADELRFWANAFSWPSPTPRLP